MNSRRPLVLLGTLACIASLGTAEAAKKATATGGNSFTHGEALCPSDPNWKDKLVIHQIDVGQGDAAVIRSPGGQLILIDSGPTGDSSAKINTVLSKCYGTTSVDYVIVTHFHADHIGGMMKLFPGLTVRQAIYDGGDGAITPTSKDSQEYKTYSQLAGATGKRSIPEVGTTIKLEGGVTAQIVAVAGKVLSGKQSDITTKDGEVDDDNSASLATLIRYGGFDFFTAGDLTGGGSEGGHDVESDLAPSLSKVDVYKASHHGSDTSNNPAILARLQPTNVLVSVGNGGRNKGVYKLPDVEAISRMAALPTVQNILQTNKGEGGQLTGPNASKVHDLQGDIVIVADKASYTINGVPFKTSGK